MRTGALEAPQNRHRIDIVPAPLPRHFCSVHVPRNVHAVPFSDTQNRFWMSSQNGMSAAGTEKAKQLAGELYHFFKDPQLLADRDACRELLHQFNTVLPYTDTVSRLEVLKKLLGGFDPASPPHIEPPIKFDFGSNTYIGSDVFINFGAIILDCNRVQIGNRVLFGPNVQLYAATHPTDPDVRNGTAGPEYALPITIEDDVWLGGGVIVLPGVTVGKGATVGAGSVVTKDVEPYTVVAGNPARLIRRLPSPAGRTADDVQAAAVAIVTDGK